MHIDERKKHVNNLKDKTMEFYCKYKKENKFISKIVSYNDIVVPMQITHL